VKWYSKAAELGDADAQNNMGYLYEKGYGVPKNYVKAEEWFQKALKTDPKNEVAKKNLLCCFPNFLSIFTSI
jgi:FOG: TPR repeat, SEL1 subfamily